MRAGATLALRADPDEVARLNDWLAAYFAAHDVPAGPAYGLKLCLNEAVANVIAHAFEGGGDEPGRHRVHVSLSLDGSNMVAVVSDDGPAFDPLSVPPSEPPTSAEEVSLGGWGIDLIRENADAVSFTREDGHNRLTIRLGYASGEA